MLRFGVHRDLGLGFDRDCPEMQILGENRCVGLGSVPKEELVCGLARVQRRRSARSMCSVRPRLTPPAATDATAG